MQGSEISLLSDWLARIRRSCADPGRIILNFYDIEFWKKVVAEQRQIEPLVRRIFQRTVVKIETVDVDDSVHTGIRKKQRPLPRPRAQLPKNLGE